MIDINAIKNLNLKLKFGKTDSKDEGGQGGSILIISEEIKGNGQITADGGDGIKGGKGGSVNIIAQKNKLRGKISAKGGEGKSGK